MLNKRSCWAAALGVTEFMTAITTILVTQSDLDIQQTHLRGWFVEQKFMLTYAKL
jgi:hypothetical protein